MVAVGLVAACLWMLAWAVGAGCPKVCECKWKDGKETVSCPAAEFIDIPRGLSPTTQVLDLTRNNLQILPAEAFLDSGLLNLQKVWLSRCNLKTLQVGAFRRLNNLVELDLGYNLLGAVPSESLKDASGLRDLRLNNNNISSLADGAFTRTPDLIKLDLGWNAISHASERAFRGLTRLELLKLSGNRLSVLRAATVAPLVAIHELHLDANPWVCDCVLRPMRRWTLERNVALQVRKECNNTNF